MHDDSTHLSFHNKCPCYKGFDFETVGLFTASGCGVDSTLNVAVGGVREEDGVNIQMSS